MKAAALIVILGTALGAPAVRAAVPEAPVADGPRVDDAPILQYRKVFVPEAEILKLPGVFLPVKQADFERLLNAVRTKYTASELTVGARVTEATYSARLIGDRLVEGQAALTIEHTAATPAVLPLDPCGLALGTPTWRAGPSSAPSAAGPGGGAAPAAESGGGAPKPSDPEAKLGYNESSRLVVVVERSGVLQWSWSLRGTRTALGELVFELRLPAASVQRLELTLASPLEPLVSRGLVTRAVSADPNEADPRWNVQLSAASEHTLRIVPARREPKRPRLTLLRQATTYRFSPEALEIEVGLDLDVYDEPLSQLVVTLDKPLQLLGAKSGSQDVPWSEPGGLPPTARPKRILELPEPILGAERRLRLQAIAPVTLATPWRLPGIQVADALWQDGTVSLVIPEPLVIEKLTPQGCRESTVRPRPAPEGGEVVELQTFQPRHSIEAVLRLRDSDLTARLGTTIRFEPNGTSGRMVADLATSGRPRFVLLLDPVPGWTIDTVQTEPADRLESWSAPRRGARGEPVEIRLRDPVRSGEPLRVVIDAHSRPARPDEPLLARNLRVGAFRKLRVTRAVVSLEAESPNRVRLAGDEELERLDGSQLPAPEAALVTAAPGGVVYVDGAAAERLKVDVWPAPLDYAVDIDLQTTVTSRSCEQRCRIRCVPEAPGIKRLQVHFSVPSSDPPQWTLAGESYPAPQARRLTEAEQALVGIAGGETWDVVLPQPQRVPFELLAVRPATRDSENPLALVSVPGATTQVGSLTILTPDATPLAVEQQNLTSAPMEPLPDAAATFTRAAFRYEPAQPGRAVVRRKPPGTASAAAWVWSGTLTSRFDPNGRAEHVAVYQLENTGLPAINLGWPEAAEVEEVAVDGHRTRPSSGAAVPGERPVPLPGGVRFPTLLVRFTTDGLPLTAWSLATTPWPRLDVPVLEATWIVWLPPGFRGVAPVPAPVTWETRLFGPLLRPAQEPVFDPSAAAAWRSVVSAEPFPPDAWDAADRLLKRLGAEAGAHPQFAAAHPLAWRELLTRCARPDSAAGAPPFPRLWIDQAELARHAVTPTTPVPRLAPAPRARGPATEPTEQSWAEWGAALLENAGLALVAHPRWLLLTSPDVVAQHTDQLRLGPGSRAAVAIQPEKLDRWLREDTQLRFTPLSAWSPGPARPWHLAADRFVGDGGGRGWTAVAVPVLGKRPAALSPPAATALRVYRPPVMQGLGWAAFLAAAGLAWWLARGRMVLGLPVTALAGAVTLLVSATVLPIFTGCFLGACTGSVLAILRAPRRTPAAAGASSSVSRLSLPASLPGAILALWAVTACAAEPAAAETATPPRPAAEPAIHRVLIPIDAARKPVGDYYFLPRAFYDAFHREADLASDVNRQRWMIAAANYRAAFSWNAVSEELTVGELTAAYQLEVFQPHTTVVLTLARDDVFPVVNWARLDGQPATAVWNEAGTALSVMVEGTGKYALELAFVPRMVRGEEQSGFDFPVPPVARAQLKLELPPEAKGVECPTAAGGATRQAQTGHQLVDLGPARRLSVQWPSPSAAEPGTPGVEADQLLWLKIRPGAVVLDTKFKFAASRGRLRQVRLLADPRLVLLPPRGEQPIAAWSEQTRAPRTLVFDLKPTPSPEVTIELSFWLRDTTGIGSLRLPWLEPVAERVLNRWLAVSVSPGLDLQLPEKSDLAPQPPDSFVTAWGPVEHLPQLSVRLSGSEPAWTLNTEPHPCQMTVDQRLDVAFGQAAVDVVFDADVETLDGDQYQYQLAGSKSLDVTSVDVRQEGADQPWPVRWSRDAQGNVVLRFAVPPRGKHRLQLRGTLPTPRAAAWELPPFQLSPGAPSNARVTLYRRSDVRLAVQKTTGYQDLTAAAAGEYRSGWGRVVAILERHAADDEPPVIRLTVEPNQPDVTARLITTVARPESVWLAEVDCALRIDHGVCDVVRLAIPAEWKEPFELEGAGELTVVSVPGQKTRHVVIRPKQAVTDALRFRIRGRLAAAGDRVRAPDIVPLDVRYAERYLVAPTKVHQQQIAWETSGLQAGALPEGYDQPVPPSAVTYRAVAPRFQATIRDVRLEAGAPHVVLADVSVACAADGTVLGNATFDLDPAGLADVELELPAGYRLIQAAVADMPARMDRLDEGRWRVALGPAHLAQPIHIVYAGVVSPEERRLGTGFVRAPRLGTLRVDRTLWTIQGAEPDAARMPSVGDWALTAQEQEVLRLQRYSTLIETAADVLAESAPRDVARWYEPSIRRLASVRNKLLQRAAQDAESAGAGAAELERIDDRQRAIAVRLGTDGLLAAGWQTPLAAVEPSVGRPLSPGPASAQHYGVFDGVADAVPLRPSVTGVDHGWMRLAAAMFLLALATVGVLVFPHPLCEPILRRGPAVLGMLFGAVWWLWLTPSLLGLAVLLLSALGGLRALTPVARRPRGGPPAPIPFG